MLNPVINESSWILNRIACFDITLLPMNMPFAPIPTDHEIRRDAELPEPFNLPKLRPRPLHERPRGGHEVRKRRLRHPPGERIVVRDQQPPAMPLEAGIDLPLMAEKRLGH